MTIVPAVNQIITEIKALGISNTYNYMPLTSTGLLLKEKWQEGDLIHGCTVLRPRAGLLPESENLPEWEHLLLIEVRRTYQDAASQAAHDLELDSILELFWGDDTLNHTVSNIERVQLTDNRPYLFFSILVHYGRIEVTVRLQE